jgi:MFS family permease
MGYTFLSMLMWIAAACGLGFAISAVFAGWLKLSRNRFLFFYVALAFAFLFGFVFLSGIEFTSILTNNWGWGILAGGLVSVLLVKTVRNQPKTRQSEGLALGVDLTWAGLVYGVMDALFLNVMPVVAIGYGMGAFDWAATFAGEILVGVVSLLASLLVTLTYHLGYPEFRNRSVGLVLLGNSLITLAFILSGSPVGSILSHTIMHLAAVWQGSETTIQLPPHYQRMA